MYRVGCFSTLDFIRVLLFGLLLCIRPVAASEVTFNLTVLHNNDFHARYAPTNVYGGPCSAKSPEDCFGGAARMVYKVKEIINAKGTQSVIYLNAGDHFQGTVWYSLYKHKIVSQFVNYFEYDAMALGNHEFDDGVPELAPFLDEVKNLPVLSCNIDVSREPRLEGKIKKSVVLWRKAVKIGVIGYTTPDTEFLASPGPTITFTDEIECIRKEVTKMKAEGITIIMAVGHSGHARDVEIAQAIPELDVVVGGHSNTFLWSPRVAQEARPSIEEPEGPYPVVVRHNANQTTLVVQAFAYGKYLGVLDVGFDNEGRIVTYDGNPFLLDGHVDQDPYVRLQVEQGEIEVKANTSRKVGETRVLLDGETCRKQECNFGNLITDSWINFFLDVRRRGSPRNRTGWTDFPLAVLNSGTIRATIDEQQRDGNMTLEDVMTVLPFGNTVQAVYLTGKVLKDLLEHGVSRYERFEGRFLQMSGLRVRYDVTRDVGRRVKSAEARCGDCRIPVYEAIDEQRTYTILITDYMAGGGDGFKMLKGAPAENFGHLGIDVLQAYLAKVHPVSPEVSGRIFFTDSIRATSVSYRLVASGLWFYALISLVHPFGLISRRR